MFQLCFCITQCFSGTKMVTRCTFFHFMGPCLTSMRPIDAVWFLLFYYLVGTSKLKTVHLQGFYQNSVSQVFWDQIKNRASSRLLAQISVSQVFWEPIKNRVSPRSAVLKAVYLEALLYKFLFRELKNKKSNCAKPYAL